MADGRTIPEMEHAPHADDCPAVGGDGGPYRILAAIHPKWRAWLRGCNCGRYYPARASGRWGTR